MTLDSLRQERSGVDVNIQLSSPRVSQYSLSSHAAVPVDGSPAFCRGFLHAFANVCYKPSTTRPSFAKGSKRCTRIESSQFNFFPEPWTGVVLLWPHRCENESREDETKVFKYVSLLPDHCDVSGLADSIVGERPREG